MSKITKSSTISKPVAKNEGTRVLSPLCELISWDRRVVTENFARNLSKAVVEWSLRDDAFIFEAFLGIHYLRSKEWWVMCKKYDFLAHSFELALQNIGVRREGLMLQGKAERSIMYTMPSYSAFWRQREQEVSQDKQQEPPKIVVEIEQIPSSSRVPMLKVKDESND
jgi:hypothetical protein